MDPEASAAHAAARRNHRIGSERRVRVMLAVLGCCLAQAPGAVAETICGVEGETAPRILERLAEQRLPVVPAPSGYAAWENRFGRILWTATREGHPAHPSVVCRKIVQGERSMHVEMQAVCDGPQAACDQLVVDFQRLTDQMRRNAQPW